MSDGMNYKEHTVTFHRYSNIFIIIQRKTRWAGNHSFICRKDKIWSMETRNDRWDDRTPAYAVYVWPTHRQRLTVASQLGNPAAVRQRMVGNEDMNEMYYVNSQRGQADNAAPWTSWAQHGEPFLWCQCDAFARSTSIWAFRHRGMTIIINMQRQNDENRRMTNEFNNNDYDGDE